MKRKTRILKKLPEWFDLEKYKRTRDLDAVGWWLQISVRRICFACLWEMQMAGHSLLDEWHSVVQQGLASLREQPICDVLSGPFINAPFFRDSSDLLPDRHGQLIAARSMTLKDLYKIKKAAQRRLSPEQVRELSKYDSDEFPLFAFRAESWNTPAVNPADFLPHDWPIIIDLRYPNSVLVEHFKALLQLLRQDPRRKPEEATKHSPDLREWASQGLLPCMDLLLWAEEKRSSVSNGLLTDALQIDDEEKVRKTIRPLATELLDWRAYPGLALDRLRALASLDLTHKYGLERGKRHKN